jgi:hypothetical protein
MLRPKGRRHYGLRSVLTAVEATTGRGRFLPADPLFCSRTAPCNTQQQQSVNTFVHTASVPGQDMCCQFLGPSPCDGAMAPPPLQFRSCTHWFQAVWAPLSNLQLSNLQAICIRRRREARCHLATDNWHRSLIYRDTSLGITVEQIVNCQWWLRWSLVCTICYTRAIYISKSE